MLETEPFLSDPTLDFLSETLPLISRSEMLFLRSETLFLRSEILFFLETDVSIGAGDDTGHCLVEF